MDIKILAASALTVYSSKQADRTPGLTNRCLPTLTGYLGSAPFLTCLVLVHSEVLGLLGQQARRLVGKLFLALNRFLPLQIKACLPGD